MKFNWRLLTGRVHKLLNFLRKMSGDFRPLFRELEFPLREQAQEIFLAQGIPSWAPLKPSTRRWREGRGFDPGGPILVASGSLRDALFGGSGSITNVTREALEVGVRHPAAAAHAFGATVVLRRHTPVKKRTRFGTRGRPANVELSATLPRRAFLVQRDNQLTIQGRQKVSDTTARFIERQILKEFSNGPISIPDGAT